MKKQDKKNFPDRKNYIKLLPAAAVIAAVTVTGVQGKAGISQKVQSESADVKDAEELTGLLATAYSYDDFSDGTSSSKAASSSSKKAKKGGIKKGTAKTLPDESQKTSAAGQGSTSTPTTSVPAGGYKDGTYQGSGTGFGGTITVQVTISGGKIASIDILSASGETPSYFASAQGVIDRMISGQTPNVDAVSGATYSSNGIIQAVQNALSKAGNDSAAVSTTPTPTARPTVKPTAIPKPAANTTYKDGTYTAEAEGFDGPVKVTITIKNGKITKMTNTNTDTREYFSKAWSKIQPAILKKQGVYGVDTVSGATFSSNGILESTGESRDNCQTDREANDHACSDAETDCITGHSGYTGFRVSGWNVFRKGERIFRFCYHYRNDQGWQDHRGDKYKYRHRIVLQKGMEDVTACNPGKTVCRWN